MALGTSHALPFPTARLAPTQRCDPLAGCLCLNIGLSRICLAQVCGQQFVGSADGVVGAVNRSINKLISDETRRTSHTTHGRSGALFSTGSHSNRPDGADIGLPTGAVTWLPDGRDGATVHPGVYPMESNLAGVATQSADNCMQVRGLRFLSLSLHARFHPPLARATVSGRKPLRRGVWAR